MQVTNRMIGKQLWSVSLSLLSLLIASFSLCPPAVTAQPAAPVAQIDRRAQGQQLMQRASQQLQQGTAESLQGAITDYQAALGIWQSLGDTQQQSQALLGLGTVYYLQSQHEAALQAFTQGLALARAAGDRANEVYFLSSIGNAYFSLDQTAKALDFYQQTLQLLQTLENPSLQAIVLKTTGNAYVKLGQPQRAIAAYQQSLTLYQDIDDQPGQISIFRALGLLYTQSGQGPAALEVLEQALSLQRQLGDQTGQLETQISLGLAYTVQGKSTSAIAAYQQAQRLLASQPPGPFQQILQATLYHGLAGAYMLSGEDELVLSSFNQALTAARNRGNQEFVATILIDQGLFYDQRGEPQTALTTFQQALKIYEDLKLVSYQTATLVRIADTTLSLGEPQRALELYQNALVRSRTIQKPVEEARTLGAMATAYRTLGNDDLAIETYQQALDLHRKVGDRTAEATTHLAIGDTHQAHDRHREALTAYQQALQLLRQEQNQFQEISVLSSVVRSYEALEDYAQAQATAERMGTLARSLELPLFTTLSQVFVGRVQRATGQLQVALDTFLQARTQLQQNQVFPIAEANLLDNIGQTYGDLKQPEPAIAAFQDQLAIFGRLGRQTDVAHAYFRLAQVEHQRARWNPAQTYIEQAIAIVESLRSKLVSPELRASYFQTVQDYYELYIDILMQHHQQAPTEGYDAQALHASERAKARSLLELLSEANADIRQGVDPQWLEQERQLEFKLSALEQLRIQTYSQEHTPAQRDRLESERKQLLAQYQQVQAAIRGNSPRYAALKYPEPLTLKTIQQQLLDPETLLLQYALGADRSYVWVVTQDQITSHVLPSRSELDTLAQQVNREMSDPSRRGTSPAATQLSQLILAPAEAQLGTKQRIVVVGDGGLQYVPFTALPLPTSATTPLVASHEVVSLPSSSTLGILRQQRQPRPLSSDPTLAILADPVFSVNDERVHHQPATRSPSPVPTLEQAALNRAARDLDVGVWNRLPGTLTEAKAITALFQGGDRTLATDFEANREAVIRNQTVNQSEILHLATHGLLNSADPRLSGLIFSLVDRQGHPVNGFLRLHDVFNLDLQAQLVVLSACQTGLGEIVRGEGIVGLTRGFMYAGAPRVVVSLWEVDDEATATLMTAFYQHMLQGGLAPAAALRQAQLDLRQTPQWQSPYYWAAFTLQGEWR